MWKCYFDYKNNILILKRYTEAKKQTVCSPHPPNFEFLKSGLGNRAVLHSVFVLLKSKCYHCQWGGRHAEEEIKVFSVMHGCLLELPLWVLVLYEVLPHQQRGSVLCKATDSCITECKASSPHPAPFSCRCGKKLQSSTERPLGDCNLFSGPQTWAKVNCKNLGLGDVIQAYRPQNRVCVLIC